MDSEKLSLEGKKLRRMALICKKDDHHVQCSHCENEIPFKEEKLLRFSLHTIVIQEASYP